MNTDACIPYRLSKPELYVCTNISGRIICREPFCFLTVAWLSRTFRIHTPTHFSPALHHKALLQSRKAFNGISRIPTRPMRGVCVCVAGQPRSFLGMHIQSSCFSWISFPCFVLWFGRYLWCLSLGHFGLMCVYCLDLSEWENPLTRPIHLLTSTLFVLFCDVLFL